MPTYVVKPGMTFGAYDQFKAGDTVDLTVEEASGFLDKIRPLDEPITAKAETPVATETPAEAEPTIPVETEAEAETPADVSEEVDAPKKSKRKS